MTHDQNFKNLILDYPHQALAFFAGVLGQGLEDARILPVRQEQLKERLGDRFRELDVPLLVEWPDGRRTGLLFLIEHHSDPARFSIHRIAHYCLDLSVLLETDQIIPVVVFTQPGTHRERLLLGTLEWSFLDFHIVSCVLPEIPAREHYESDNLVARLNLPNMAHEEEERVDVYGQAVRGLMTLEQDPERQLKYLDFIDIYAGLTENEQAAYRERYPEEEAQMKSFSERFWEKGRQEGRQEGLEQGIEKGLEKGLEKGRQEGLEQGIEKGLARGESLVLRRLLTLRFGEIPEAVQQRIDAADAETLLLWSERVLTASTLDDIFA